MESLSEQIRKERKMAEEKEKINTSEKRDICYKSFIETISKNRESITQTFVDNPEALCVDILYENKYDCRRYYPEPVTITGEVLTVQPIHRKVDEGYGFFSYQDFLTICLVEKKESFIRTALAALRK